MNRCWSLITTCYAHNIVYSLLWVHVVVGNSSLELAQTARMLLYVELKWVFSPKFTPCSHGEGSLSSFFLTALWIIEGTHLIISLTILPVTRVWVPEHSWLPNWMWSTLSIPLLKYDSQNQILTHSRSFSGSSLGASRKMVYIRSWQTFPLKNHLVNNLALRAIWSLLQLLSSAGVAWRQPQTICKQESTAVFQ